MYCDYMCLYRQTVFLFEFIPPNIIKVYDREDLKIPFAYVKKDIHKDFDSIYKIISHYEKKRIKTKLSEQPYMNERRQK